MSVAPPEIEQDSLEDLFNLPSYAKEWVVLCLDCDCHDMGYVTAVFMKHFKLSELEAMQKMAEVHFEGQTVLAHGKRDEMLLHKEALNAYGLRSMIEEQA